MAKKPVRKSSAKSRKPVHKKAPKSAARKPVAKKHAPDRIL